MRIRRVMSGDLKVLSADLNNLSADFKILVRIQWLWCSDSVVFEFGS